MVGNVEKRRMERQNIKKITVKIKERELGREIFLNGSQKTRNFPVSGYCMQIMWSCQLRGSEVCSPLILFLSQKTSNTIRGNAIEIATNDNWKLDCLVLPLEWMWRRRPRRSKVHCVNYFSAMLCVIGWFRNNWNIWGCSMMSLLY